MNILYLMFHGFSESSGISKKVKYQIDALKTCGATVRLCYLDDNQGHQRQMIDDEILKDYGISLKGKLRRLTDYSALYHYIEKNKIDLLYVRSLHNASPFLTSFFRKLKKRGVKVLLEIPTYPYDEEYKGTVLEMRFRLLIDKCFRKSMAKQLYRILTYSDHKRIWNVPTINISNGIDFNAVRIKKEHSRVPNTLNLIGVAEIHSWHGFDRLIWGLVEYYKTPQEVKVYFDLIGEYGPFTEAYQKIVDEYNLQPYVRMHGCQYGEALDEYFDNADMGVASLARHRSGITKIKTLKSREYAARGIPFIYSEIDDDFEQMPFIKKIPPNEDPVDIQSLIDFYNSVKLSPDQIRDSIKHLSWENQMRKMLSLI